MVAFLEFVAEQFFRVCRGTAFRVSFIKLATNRVSKGRTPGKINRGREERMQQISEEKRTKGIFGNLKSTAWLSSNLTLKTFCFGFPPSGRFSSGKVCVWIRGKEQRSERGFGEEGGVLEQEAVVFSPE